MKKIEILGCGLLLSSFFIYFVAAVYPSVDEFTFGYLRPVLTVQTTGIVGFQANYPGYNVYMMAIHTIGNIPYDVIPTVPVVVIPIILLIIASFRKICAQELIYIPIVAAYLVGELSPATSTSPHHVGFALLFLIILTSILYSQAPAGNRKKLMAIMFIAVVSINFVSFTETAIALIFLAIFLLLQRADILRGIKIDKRALLALVLFAAFFTLLFNQYLYSAVLPALHATDPASFLGFDKLLRRVSPQSADVLSSFYLVSPPVLTFTHLLTYLLLTTCFALCCYVVFKKYAKRTALSLGEVSFLSLSGAGLFALFFYVILGLANIAYLTIAIFVGYGVIYQMPSKAIKRFVVVSIVVLFLLNGVATAERINNNFYSQNRGSVDYLNAPSGWFLHYDGGQRFATDLLTENYYKFYKTSRGLLLPDALSLSSSDVKTILNLNTVKNSSTATSSQLYMMNYREGSIKIYGPWDVFAPWSDSRQTISNNSNLSKIYSSGDVEIMAKRAR